MKYAGAALGFVWFLVCAAYGPQILDRRAENVALPGGEIVSYECEVVKEGFCFVHCLPQGVRSIQRLLPGIA